MKGNPQNGNPDATELAAKPIGFARSPFKEKADAPRQAPLASGTKASIEILPEYRDGLSDLEGFERIWILFWFDQAEGPTKTKTRWHSKVLPPRSEEKRGVFATRSPHRPNPIGMSAVRLERVDFDAGRLHILDFDLIDGTPVLDIKPYIPYADAFPNASAGWLDAADPQKAWTVTFEPLAEEMLAWIVSSSGSPGVDLRERIATSLALGPQPHAYRRIKTRDDGKRILAVKEWRVCFRVDDFEAEKKIVVESIATGYRARDLAEGSEPIHSIHRAFVARFGSTSTAAPALEKKRDLIGKESIDSTVLDGHLCALRFESARERGRGAFTGAYTRSASRYKTRA